MIDTFTMETQAERSSGVITATLTDETGAPVALASMTALRLTLYDQRTRKIINTRKDQNVLNANNVTMGAANGLVTWAVQPDDMAIVTPGAGSGGPVTETHLAIFVAKWSGGTKEHPWQITLPVVNYGMIPA